MTDKCTSCKFWYAGLDERPCYFCKEHSEFIESGTKCANCKHALAKYEGPCQNCIACDDIEPIDKFNIFFDAVVPTLLDVCQQYMRYDENGTLSHDFMSAGEGAMTILEKMGYVTDIGGGKYKVIDDTSRP